MVKTFSYKLGNLCKKSSVGPDNVVMLYVSFFTGLVLRRKLSFSVGAKHSPGTCAPIRSCRFVRCSDYYCPNNCSAGKETSCSQALSSNMGLHSLVHFPNTKFEHLRIELKIAVGWPTSHGGVRFVSGMAGSFFH